MKTTFITILLCCLSVLVSDVWAQYDLDFLEYRSVGPYRGGRVTAVAGTAQEPSTFYLGATGGGVWKTTDYGTRWANISDGHFTTPSVGAIAVAHQDPNIVYVGTGSDGLRSNVILGKGVYKSIDAGSTWQHIGLDNVGQIGAMVIHPSDHNTVFVAAIGQPFKANEERGVYRTTDGGRSWERVLFHSNQVGFSDVEMLPGNPNILFATAWKAERKPWTIISGGTPEEGGIYKSVDGGTSWQKVTRGLPKDLIGKIDVAVCPSDSRIVYALVEAPGDEGGLYKSEDQGKSFSLVSSFRGIRTRPFYYTNIRIDPQNSEIVYALATGYYKSVDGGKTWVRMRPPHGDNHDMWINPDNPRLFIQANDGGANVTHNGGESWSTQFNQPTAELYQVEVDNQFPYWLYAGQQDNYTTIAVPSLPPDARQVNGIGWIINTGGCETGPAVPHPNNPDIVYSNCKGRFGVFDKRTGVERSYYVGASNMYGHNPKDLRYRFQRVSPIHISPHNPDVVYHTSQFVHRTTDEGVTWETISPDLTAFEEDKQVISGSPITRDITGEEFYSTIYSIRESPITPGLIWTGANDGPIQVTRDNGANWKNVTPTGLPAGGRVDAVEPSPHDPAKAYAAVLRYQLGDERPYIYRTNDYGASWTLLSGKDSGIPQDFPTRVVREDPERAGLLYAGTEYGMFISFDDGTSWEAFQQNLPVTPITDIKCHQGDLVLSTMGRGFWIMDGLHVLHDETFSSTSDQIYLFEPEATVRYRSPMVRGSGDIDYPNPGLTIDYFLPTGNTNAVEIRILTEDGTVVNAFRSDSLEETKETIENMGLNQFEILQTSALATEAGIQRFRWDLKAHGAWHAQSGRAYRSGPMVPPGSYRLELRVGDQVEERSFVLLPDPRVPATDVSVKDMRSQFALQQNVNELLSQARRLEAGWKKAHRSMSDKEKKSTYGAALAEVLSAMRSEEGVIYPQPMLIQQIEYLGFMLRGADQRPGKDALDRYAELKDQLKEWETYMAEAKASD
ncbi:MAG: hypothetical protein AAFZ63_24875 [Bacteroidota bacterium]